MAPVVGPEAGRSKTVVEAAADVLRKSGRPMHAHEIAQTIISSGIASLTGATPWKTVTSRISTDIRSQQGASVFQRVGHALFALREWGDPEFLVNRRHINPIEETIKVVPAGVFRQMLQARRGDDLWDLNIEHLMAASTAMKRANAEETTNFVQLIPTFLIRCGDALLTYTRTKRLPEARLHHFRCVSFGGHMRADDLPDLFARSYSDAGGPLFRELYEELNFSNAVAPVFLGVIYLTGSDFELQHAGIVFRVDIADQSSVRSLEHTMHSDVKFMQISDLVLLAKELDSWSRTLVGVVDGQ